jgi:amino acid adenylation domain-containing protein
MKALTGDELVEKYDSYLPADITHFDELLKFLDIDKDRLEPYRFLDESVVFVPNLDQKLDEHISTSPQPAAPGACRILLLDLSQFFSNEEHMLYDVVEPPLGLMYLLTYLNRRFGDKVVGKIAKSRIDFDNYDELKALLIEFKPDVIGIRTLTFYRNFFHQTIAMIRQWGMEVPVLAGGPYATSDYHALLQDRNIDLAVLGEGEIIFAALVEKILENGNRLPSQEVLRDIPGIAFIPDRPEHLSELAAEVIPLDRLTGVLSGRGVDNLPPAAQPGDPAYIIFTSGSTGKPKGVIIEHRNVVRLFFNDGFQFDFSRQDVWTLFHSYCFDFSVWEMYGALFYGGKSVLVPRLIARDTEAFLELLREEQVTVLNQTPSAFYNLIEIQAGTNNKQLGLRYVIFGGEALSPARLREWRRKYPGTKLINMFGITETTVHVTYKEITEQEIEAGISNIGKPIPTLGTYIMDSCRRLLPPGVPGELYVGGAGVGRGYLNRPELTYEKFCRGPGTPAVRRKKMPMETVHHAKHRTPSLPCKCPPTQWGFSKEPPGRRRQKLYRTGDRVRLLENGDMDYLGRIDRQVQIRGFRVEPGEIRSRLEAHPRVKEAVVISKELNDDLHLCAYIVPGDMEAFDSTSPIRETLKDYLARSLPDYMIPAFFVLMKNIPLTSNGKVDKKALPEPDALSADKYTAPRDEMEERLAAIWTEVLIKDFLHPPIGIDDNFFELGGHSLKTILMVSKINREFDVKIPIPEVFTRPTIRELSQLIKRWEKSVYSPLVRAEKKEYYLLSPAQKGIYIQQQMFLDNTSYNTTEIQVVEGNMNKEKLESIIKELINRHESLRTSFQLLGDNVFQRIHDHHGPGFRVEYRESDDREVVEALLRNFVKPFDLSRAPLLRAWLVKMEESKYIMMLDMHHIISDGVSKVILVKEFVDLYLGKSLPLPPLHYKDFSEWRNRWLEGKEKEKQEAYWLEVLYKRPPLLDLPLDYPRPAVPHYEAHSISFELDRPLTEKIKDLALETQTTLYMVLLAVYNILLSKYTGREDIVVGSPISGRKHADTQEIIGMFANILPLRNQPRDHQSFGEFLADVKKNVLEAFENQDYQYGELVEKMGLRGGWHSLFNVAYSFGDLEIVEIDYEGLKDTGDVGFQLYPYGTVKAKYDLAIVGVENKGVIHMILQYDRELFKQDTAEKISTYYIDIVRDVVENREKPLKDIEIPYQPLAVESQKLLKDLDEFEF